MKQKISRRKAPRREIIECGGKAFCARQRMYIRVCAKRSINKDNECYQCEKWIKTIKDDYKGIKVY